MWLGFSSVIGDGYVGLIELFWVFVGLSIFDLIGDSGVGLISNGGVGLIRFFWVFGVRFDQQ